MNDASEEARCLTRIADGDQAALDALYDRYRPRLWRYLTQLGTHADQIEEVMQDVFLAVWRRAATFRGDSSVAVWIFSIARHQLHNTCRHAQRRPEGHSQSLITDDELLNQPYMRSSSPEETVIARLTLMEALARLSSEHREVLALAFGHGFAMEEIATILHIPIGTVKSRLHAARRALTHSLDAVEEVAPHER